MPSHLHSEVLHLWKVIVKTDRGATVWNLKGHVHNYLSDLININCNIPHFKKICPLSKNPEAELSECGLLKIAMIRIPVAESNGIPDSSVRNVFPNLRVISSPITGNYSSQAENLSHCFMILFSIFFFPI